MRRRSSVVFGMVALAAALASFAAGASAARTSFTLTFTGAHVADTTLPAGIRHEGRFTASAPFCPAGTAFDLRDVAVEPLTVLRVHTCDDGTGSFTALMQIVRGEHGGTGPWKIVEGTSRYATLRGVGTYAGVVLSGSDADFVTLTYRTTWQGVVDFDAVPPTVGIRIASVKKLRRPSRTYVVRVALQARDDRVGDPVRYTLDARAGASLLVLRNGATTSGKTTIAFRLRVPRGARRLQFIATASDAVGNEGTSRRSLRLR